MGFYMDISVTVVMVFYMDTSGTAVVEFYKPGHFGPGAQAAER